MVKSQNVMQEDWDYLIILDACRYDFFKKNYDDFLEGELEKRDSGAGGTPEWLYKTFKDMNHDISYFSANPFVNSKGIDISELGYRNSWDAAEHFGHIIDAWDKIWDDGKNTVKPDDLTKLVKNMPKMNRVIVHYIQPHLPYLHEGFDQSVFTWAIKNIAKNELNDDNQSSLGYRITIFIFYDCLRMLNLSKIKEYKIRNFFKTPTVTNKEDIFREYGLERLREFYKHNLKTVLQSVSKLIKSLSGKIVITSDHGECFGEHGLLFHQNHSEVKTLREVPWLEVKN